jgi:hypothetical protein
MQQLPNEDALRGSDRVSTWRAGLCFELSRHKGLRSRPPVPARCRNAMREAVCARPASGFLDSNPMTDLPTVLGLNSRQLTLI